MKNKKIILAAFVFLLSFVCKSNEILAQNPKINLSEKSAKSYFKEGETIIADVRFDGLDRFEDYKTQPGYLIYESDARYLLRQNNIQLSNGKKLVFSEVEKANKILKEWLKANGYFNGNIAAVGEKLNENQILLTFSIKRGIRSSASEIRFVENSVFTNQELIESLKKCLGSDWQIFEKRRYEYYVQTCTRELMFSKGYLTARIGEIEPQLVSNKIIVTIPVEEGVRFRLGEIKIEGANVFSSEQILQMLGQKAGDILDGKALREFLYEELKRIYSAKGYIQFDAEFDPEFIKPQIVGQDGKINLRIILDEGRAFKVAKLNIIGIEPSKAQQFQRMLAVKEGEIFNQVEFENAIEKINNLKKFKFIDKDRDVEMRVDEETNELYLKIEIHDYQALKLNGK